MGLEHAVRPGEMDRAMYALDRAVMLDRASRSQIAHYLEQQGNRKEAARYRGTRPIVAGDPPRGMEFYGDSQHDTRHVYSSAELFTSGSNALNEDLRGISPTRSGSPSIRSRRGNRKRKRKKRVKRNKNKNTNQNNQRSSEKRVSSSESHDDNDKKKKVPRPQAPRQEAPSQKSGNGGMASDHSRPPPRTKKEDLYAEDEW
jgi:hypothetical protein